MHDHNKINYNDEYNFTNAECCVHLIRDLQRLNEVLPREWINKLIELLVTTNAKRKDYINKSIMYFDQEVTDKVILSYDEIITEAKEVNRKDFNKYYGCEEKTLIKSLEQYKDNYLLWVLRFEVPFSNNLSERSLRSSKTKMKVSGQFANIQNAKYFARIKSYIETCKRNDINVYDALCKLINDNPYKIEDMKTD
ncbi:MAG: transposase [Bacilli bacterium]|nr:transposase [Bacilli bacterium]